MGEMVTKLKKLVEGYEKNKENLTSLLTNLVNCNSAKYAYYVEENLEQEMQLIRYDFEITNRRGEMLTLFEVDSKHILEMLMDYADFLMGNLSFQRMLQEYAQAKHGVDYAAYLKKGGMEHSEIDIIDEILRSADNYSFERIVRSQRKEKFRKQVSSVLTWNVREVNRIIGFYNCVIQEFYDNFLENKQTNYLNLTF